MKKRKIESHPPVLSAWLIANKAKAYANQLCNLPDEKAMVVSAYVKGYEDGFASVLRKRKMKND